MSTSEITGSSTSERGAAGPRHPDSRRWVALGVVAAAQLMVVLDGSIVNIALPSAQAELGISAADRQWVVTAYVLAFGGLLPLGGRVADHAGRKRVFVVGLVGFALASALGGLATSATTLFAARALQGAFAALLTPAALALITTMFTEPRERARAFGVYGAVSGGGAAVGVVLGGLLTEYASWRWCLLVNVPIAAAAAVAALVVVRESRATGARGYDVPGAVLVTAGLTALDYGVTQAGEATGWGSRSTLVPLAVGTVLIVSFVVVQAHSRSPLLPLRLLTERNRAGALLTWALMGASLFALFLFLGFYLQQQLGYSPLRSGLAFLPISAGIMTSAGLASALLPRLGPKVLLLAGAVLSAAGLAWLTRIDLGGSFLAVVLPAEVAISAGMGLTSVAASALALHRVDDRDAGVASALLNTTQQIGGALGTALLNSVYTATAASFLALRTPSLKGAGPSERLADLAAVAGYQRAFTAGALLMVAAFVAVVVMVTIDRSSFAAPVSRAPRPLNAGPCTSPAEKDETTTVPTPTRHRPDREDAP